ARSGEAVCRWPRTAGRCCRCLEGSAAESARRAGPSAAARVHLAPGLGAKALDLVQHAAVREGRALLGAPIDARPPRVRNPVLDLRIRRAAPEQLAEIDAALAVEAEQERSIGSE